MIRNLVTCVVLMVVAAVIHYISVMLFHTNSVLFGFAEQATALNGAQRAAFWSEFFVLWLPIAIGGFGFVYLVAGVFRRQTRTGVRRGP